MFLQSNNYFCSLVKSFYLATIFDKNLEVWKTIIIIKMGSCLGSCYSCCCCQCNFLVFPGAQPTYSIQSFQNFLQFFTNSSGQKVPYFQDIKKSPRHSIIFFHGNAEDIGSTSHFLGQISQKINANIFSMQYPTYGEYPLSIPMRISNKIKSNSEQFYQHLKKKQLIDQNVIIIGRSIGSGGATYLACRKKLKNLVLISPFSKISYVAQDLVGCISCFVKQHFNNLEELQNFEGRLLLIHGERDEVINVRHGKMLVQQYIRKNPINCVFTYPKNMSHNHFNFQIDIERPIIDFIKSSEKR